MSPAETIRWTPWSRLGFRLAASYLLVSWLTVYGVLQVIPWIGFRLEGWVESAWGVPVQWLGVHVFHISGIAATFHATDSRDTALSWITAGLVVPVALIIAALWSVVDRRRPNYETAAVWLRYVLRLALIFLMLRYALMKIYPLQMPPPSLAVLHEPVGNMSPMTLLWTTIGLHPAYEMLAGWIEATAAVLLIFKRTALLGAILAIFVMSNVLLYNLFFDVPVKLGAANILILATALIVPDLCSLWRLFVLHQPAQLASCWIPPSRSRIGEVLFRAGSGVLVACALIQFLPAFAGGYAQMQAHLRHPSPFTGIWHVDSVLKEKDGSQVSLPVLTGLGQPMTEITFEPTGGVMVRAADGSLWRAQASIDAGHHTLGLDSGYFDGERFAATYSATWPDADHLILSPVGASAATNGVVTLSRVSLPKTYPLLDRKFAWINEWALER